MINLRQWLRYLALMAAGAAVAVLLAEIGLRIAGISYPRFWTTDPYCGHAHHPLAEGWYSEEGGAYVQINSDGSRGPEYTKVKPPSTLRIAVLGDSYTEAIQVPQDETFCAVLEKDLRGCRRLAERKVQVLNFGVAGYGTAQELLTLRHGVWDYSPDIIILAFYTENDLSDNSPVLASQRSDDWPRPFFKLRGGALVVDNSFRESSWYRTRRSWLWGLFERVAAVSRVVQVLRESLVHMGELRWEQSLRNPGVQPVITEAVMQGSDVYKEPSDPAWQEAWQVTEQMIIEMHKEVVQRGADFLVVTLSNPIQVYPDAKVREEFMRMTGVRDLFYPDQRLSALGEREGFKVLDLAQPFQKYADEHHIFLHGFRNTIAGTGHWNVQGHELAGEMIAREVCAESKF
jgi:hypothetical protein